MPRPVGFTVKSMCREQDRYLCSTTSDLLPGPSWKDSLEREADHNMYSPVDSVAMPGVKANLHTHMSPYIDYLTWEGHGCDSHCQVLRA